MAAPAVKTLLAVAFATLAASAAAQQAGPVVYDVDGVRVVHLPIPGHELAAAHIYLLGGSQALTPELSGAERLILRASERGTVGFPGDSVREAEVATGSEFFAAVTPDWSVLGFTGLVEEFERSWAVTADRVARPALDPSAVEVARAQILTSIRAGRDDPDTQVRVLAEGLAFAGHVYAADVYGTEATITALQVEALRAHHTSTFVRSRLLVSVVGGVDRAAVESAIRSTLGTLPVGSFAWHLPGMWRRPDADIVVEARPLPTNYIVGYFAGPPADHEHYHAFRVAISALSGAVSSEVRAQGLSYSAGASLIDRAASGGSIYVSTVRPRDVIDIVNDVITYFSEGTIPRSALRDYARGSTLEYYLSNQSLSQRADFQATSLLLRGAPQDLTGWIDDLRSVSGGQIRAIFIDYIRNIQYAYLGSERAVPREAMLRN